MRPFLLVAALVAAFSFSAQAQARNCVPRQDALSMLARNHGETPAQTGVSSTGALVEVLTRPDGATWSILVTMPGGLSCLVAAGEGWRSVAPGPAQPGAAEPGAGGPET